MIRIENLTKVFHAGTVNENIALRNVDLTVKEGDFITIVGSNGAGKTTLFNAISGNQPPTEGRIFVNDAEVTGYSRIRCSGPRRTWRSKIT
jgi:putative ABC transport system ATP-binding protein